MHTFRRLTWVWFRGLAICSAGAVSAPNGPSAALQEVEAILRERGIEMCAESAQHAVAEALLRTVDPGGALLTPAETAALEARQRGQVFEPGLRVSVANGAVRLLSIDPDAEAEAPDLKPEDWIVHIDANEVGDHPTPETIQAWLRGPSDTIVYIVARGAKDSATHEGRLRRKLVQLSSVAVAEELPMDLAYLRLNGLYSRDGRDAIETLRAWQDAGRFGAILDVRGANGDNLEGAAELAGLMAPPSTVLATLQDFRGRTLHTYRADAEKPLTGPIIILVDAQTCGAAEALTIFLAGRGRGVLIVGERTAGDPGVREKIPLSSGETLYVATRRLVTPDGAIHAGQHGLKPDIEVAPATISTPPDGPRRTTLNPERPDQDSEAHRLRERVKQDAVLQRAVDVLLGLRALNLHAS